MFEFALKKMLKNEGCYSDNPSDSGGKTKYGISKKSYPNLNIKKLTESQAKKIYKKDYWDRLKLDNINNLNIASSIFDFAVNVGNNRATKIVQKIVKTKVDGIIGKKTIRAINSYDSLLLDLYFTLEKIRFYIELVEKNRKNYTFILGWLKRCFNFVE